MKKKKTICFLPPGNMHAGLFSISMSYRYVGDEEPLVQTLPREAAFTQSNLSSSDRRHRHAGAMVGLLFFLFLIGVRDYSD
jgi:hypothetical protein